MDKMKMDKTNIISHLNKIEGRVDDLYSELYYNTSDMPSFGDVELKLDDIKQELMALSEAILMDMEEERI